MNGDGTKKTFKDRWREAWPILLGTLAYMVPLFWLWQRTGYPESFGFRITAHGKGGLIESWWYSYLLIERHGFWDVITFAYMWLAVATVARWLIHAVIADHRDRKAGTQRKGDAA